MTTQAFLRVALPSAVRPPSAVKVKVRGSCSVLGQLGLTMTLNTHEAVPSGSMVPIWMELLSKLTYWLVEAMVATALVAM